MNPICDMDEQASVLFRLTENRARSAPRNIVTSPRTNTTVPNVRLSKRTVVPVMRIPKMPTFVRIPDSRADAGDGATGWAFGSHTCTGNMPALAPKPKRMQNPAARILDPAEGASVMALSEAAKTSRKASVPQVSLRRSSPIKRTRPPITAIKR